MKWQPIETAPKDGTPIYIANKNWSTAPIAKWGEHDGYDENMQDIVFDGWYIEDSMFCAGVEDGFLGWNEDIDDGAMPTHWMPALG